jgi:hypothetical protein
MSSDPAVLEDHHGCSVTWFVTKILLGFGFAGVSDDRADDRAPAEAQFGNPA